MRSYSPEWIREEISEIYSVIRRLTDDEILNGTSSRLQQPFDRLDRLAALQVEEEVVEEIIRDLSFEPVLEAIARLRRLYGLRMEMEQARLIIAGPDPRDMLKDFVFYPNYQQLAQTEYEGAGLHSGDRVVFMGSGPLPLSLIVLCTQYGIEGIGIEKAPEYDDISRKILERLQLSELIRITGGNHFSLPLEENCPLIMVAAAARPKREIFSHFAKALKPGVKVSYRIYEKGLRRLLDTGSSFDLPKGFQEYLRVHPKPPVNNTVVFLSKTT